MTASSKLQLLADRFVSWQGPFGRPDPQHCPFVTPGPCVSTQFHSPTFLAIALYRAFEALGDARYKEAADRYVIYYFGALRDPQPGEQRLDYPSYPFMYGMALAAYEDFRAHNPDETSFDGKADAIFGWLLRFRWDEGSYFRNGYGNAELGVIDSGFSEDNLNMGRGLVGYHAVNGRADVLEHAEGLATYYLTPVRMGRYDGIWSEELGTWAVSPNAIDSFEHFSARPGSQIAWGFTVAGTIEYLTRLFVATKSGDLRERIPEKCVASMRWQFDTCQFEDGAVGLADRDDRWLGMTASSILSFLRVRAAGFLTDEEVATYRPRAIAARAWLLANLTAESIDVGGYFKVTGRSEPRPPENLAWMLAWVAQALVRLDEI